MLHVILIAASFIAGTVFSSVASTDDSNYDSDNDNDGGLVSHIVTYDEMLKIQFGGYENLISCDGEK